MTKIIDTSTGRKKYHVLKMIAFELDKVNQSRELIFGIDEYIIVAQSERRGDAGFFFDRNERWIS